MKFKEKIAYILGFIVIIIGAFGGKDLSNMNDVFEGAVMIMFFVSIYLMFLYVNKRGVGDWDRYRE
jgi:Na+/pantothenate symporter